MTAIAQNFQTAQPNRADILAHLSALFPPDFVHPYPDAQIEIAYGVPGSLDRAELFSAFRLEDAADFAVAKNSNGCNVYVGPTLKKGSATQSARTKDADFLAGIWTWSDYDAEGDFERAKSIAGDCGLAPGIIVGTGTVPHVRAHAYFKLAGGVTDCEEMRALNKALQKCLGGDPVQAPSHVMRLAGTLNYPTQAKYGRGYAIEPVTALVQRRPREHSAATILGLHPHAGAKANDRTGRSGLGFDLPRNDEELLTLLEASRTPGQWHNSIRGAIATMIGRGWTDTAIRLACAPYCDRGATDPDLTPLIEGARSKWGKPNEGSQSGVSHVGKLRQEPNNRDNDIVTEDSIALAFVNFHRDTLKYCHSTGAWYKWNSVFWEKDLTGFAFHSAREIARQLSDDQNAHKRYTINKSSFAAGVERYAKNDPKIAVIIDSFDSDPWLLGTPGGTVDLRTGEVREPRQHDGITKCTLVAPLDTGCPRWLQFLNEATGGDKELIRFLQQWCGYCLTGITREHTLVFVYGPGGNGKSVFLNVVMSILADYAVTAAMDTFTSSKNDKHPTDLAMLRGARLVTASETEENRAWAEARIKQMTGGDRISARFMRQDFFEFTPQFKLMIAGNHKPVLRNVDEAARRRFLIVPLEQKPAQPDRQLEEKLIAEAPGILHWMIEGCLDWQANGLLKPPSVNTATQDYFSDQDLFEQWLEEECQCEKDNRYLTATSSELFTSWKQFAAGAGHPPGTRQSFGDQMARHGFQYTRDRRSRMFRGVRLKPKRTYDDDE